MKRDRVVLPFSHVGASVFLTREKRRVGAKLRVKVLGRLPIGWRFGTGAIEDGSARPH